MAAPPPSWCSTSTGTRGSRPAAGSCSRHMDMGQLMKCDAVYETPFWREDGLNGFGLNDSGAVRVVVRQLPARRRARRAARVRRRLDLAQLRHSTRVATPPGRGARGLRRDVRRAGAAARSSTSSTTGPRSAGPAAARSRSWARHDDVRTARRSGARSAACTGPAPRPRRTGPATWTAPCAPASGPRPRSSTSS